MMVSPSVAADENWKVAEGKFCSPGDYLSTFNNYWDASDTQAGLGMLPQQRVPTLSHGGVRATGDRVLQANGEKPTSLHPAQRWIPRALTWKVNVLTPPQVIEAGASNYIGDALRHIQRNEAESWQFAELRYSHLPKLLSCQLAPKRYH